MGGSSGRPSRSALLTTGICILVGYPLAYFLAQLPTRAANLCLIAVLLPFWTSLLVRTYAWLVLLQRQGLINDWAISLGLWDEPLKLVHNMTGTLIGMVHIMLPFLVLPLYGAMRAIDRDYLRASANLGASPARAFWTVFVPLSLPGLFAGALIVFVLCLGFFVTPAVLGGGRVIMVSMQIATNIELFVNWGAASALGVVLLPADLRDPRRRGALPAPRADRRRRPLMRRWLSEPATETQVTHAPAPLALRPRHPGDAVPRRADADRRADVVLRRRSISNSRRRSGRRAGTTTISARPSGCRPPPPRSAPPS